MEPEKKQTPLDYAAAPGRRPAPWLGRHPVLFGLALSIAFFALVSAAALVADAVHSFVPITIILFPAGWAMRWLIPEMSWTRQAMVNCLFWGFTIAFAVRLRWLARR